MCKTINMKYNEDVFMIIQMHASGRKCHADARVHVHVCSTCAGCTCACVQGVHVCACVQANNELSHLNAMFVL